MIGAWFSKLFVICIKETQNSSIIYFKRKRKIVIAKFILYSFLFRNWDQFETNEALFGVKSTFDEDLYTTKLEKGPKMRELEKEALRIAREIEGEDTQDLHAAEVRLC